jgi:hypothetical protein
MRERLKPGYERLKKGCPYYILHPTRIELTLLPSPSAMKMFVLTVAKLAKAIVGTS